MARVQPHRECVHHKGVKLLEELGSRWMSFNEIDRMLGASNKTVRNLINTYIEHGFIESQIALTTDGKNVPHYHTTTVGIHLLQIVKENFI